MTLTAADLHALDDLATKHPQQIRWEQAARVKQLSRVNLPRLSSWNYGPCEHHEVATPSCEYRKCGGDFFDHQTLSISWFYIAHQGLDQSSTGLGKTNTALGTLALLKDRGETLRAVVVCTASAVAQWADEIARFAPGLNAVSATSGLTKSERLRLYASDWEVLVIGFQLLTRDIDALTQVGVAQMVCDDVDPILNPKNKTARAINQLTEPITRVLTFNATSLQTRLQQLWAATQLIGGKEVFGSLSSFERRYVRKEPVYIQVSKTERRKTIQSVGYKNLSHFRALFEPMQIRHSYESVRGDMGIPATTPPQIIPLEM